jgi:SSS family solute:Na+ symporter
MKTFASSINLAAELATIDWLIISSVICVNIALIIYSNKNKAKSIFEYMLMGRRLTTPLFVATLVATWYGGIFGVTQITFEQGIYNLFTQGIFWYCTYLLFAFYLVKKIRAYDAITLPDLVRKIYGERSAVFTASLVFFKTMPVVYAMSIGLLLQMLLQISFLQATCLGVVFVILYSIYGGLRTIVYSNTFQLIFMCLGVVGVLGFSVYNFGGIGFLSTNLPASYFQPCGTKSISTMLVWIIIACSTTFISPAFYQRCFAAQNDRTAKIGIILATSIWIILDICTTLGAMYAKAVIPEADSLYAYVTYGIQLLPHGLRGILVISLLATILSTLDAKLFIASNILFFDLPWLKIKQTKLKKACAVLTTALCTIIIANMFGGKIEQVWFVTKSYFSACLLLPILFGYFFPKYANDRVFYLSGVLSCINMTLWHWLGANIDSGIDSFYIGCITSLLIFGLFVSTQKIFRLFRIQNNYGHPSPSLG